MCGPFPFLHRISPRGWSATRYPRRLARGERGARLSPRRRRRSARRTRPRNGRAECARPRDVHLVEDAAGDEEIPLPRGQRRPDLAGEALGDQVPGDLPPVRGAPGDQHETAQPPPGRRERRVLAGRAPARVQDRMGFLGCRPQLIVAERRVGIESAEPQPREREGRPSHEQHRRPGSPCRRRWAITATDSGASRTTWQSSITMAARCSPASAPAGPASSAGSAPRARARSASCARPAPVDRGPTGDPRRAWTEPGAIRRA